MPEQEEQQLREYFHRIALESDEVQEYKLDDAIRTGLARGGRKKLNLRRAYVIGMSAILLFLLLIITPWQRNEHDPEEALMPLTNWGPLEAFRPILSNNKTVTSALDAGLAQHVGLSSVETDGYVFTVNGVVSDKKGLIMLFSLQNNNKDKIVMSNLQVHYEGMKEGLFFSSESRKDDFGNPGLTREYGILSWGADMEKQKEITVEITLFSGSPQQQNKDSEFSQTKLAVSFVLEDLQQAAESEVISLQRKIEINGQKIEFKEAYVGATGIYIALAYDSHNSMRIFNLISPQIALTRKGEREVLLRTEERTDSSKYQQILRFENDNLRPDSTLEFKMDGIVALEKSDLELVIDTEKREIIKAPDERLRISPRMAKEDEGVVVLELLTPKEGKGSYINNAMILDHNFVDAAGSGHWLEPYRGTYSDYSEFREDTEDVTRTYLYNTGKEKLPQPLTFKLSLYPNAIWETKTINIR